MTTSEERARAYIRRWCVAYIGRMRAILKRTWPDLKQKFPNHRSPCHTCAFNPATDSWPGFEKTVTGLMFAIEDGKPFYCHDKMPQDDDGQWQMDPDHAQLCTGWAALAGEPGLKSVAVAALREAGTPPGDFAWDENKGFTYAKGSK